MQRLAQGLNRLMEWALIVLLAGMAGMVLLNVILRYAFNSGLTFSEEMSRYLFVWLTFIGAVLTFGENAHLGMETVVRRLGRRGRLTCMALTNVIVLVCAGVMFWGTALQHDINASMVAPVVGIPMIWVFGVGYFTALGVGVIAAVRLGRIIAGRTGDAEIARFAGEWDDAAPPRSVD